MEALTSFLFSDSAGVVANYICKWLNGEGKKGNPYPVLLLIPMYFSDCFILKSSRIPYIKG